MTPNTDKPRKKIKYSKEVVKEICGFIQAGNNYKDSAIMAGVSYESLNRWRKDNKKFAKALERAKTRHKARLIAIIAKAAVKTWQASAWLLERRFKDEYAQKQTIEHEGEIKTKTELIKQLLKPNEDKPNPKGKR